MSSLPNRHRVTPAHGVPERVRDFVDADGTRWRVYEQEFGEYDRRRGMSLIFASEAAVRRVRDYPAHWHEFSEEELLALSWKS